MATAMTATTASPAATATTTAPKVIELPSNPTETPMATPPSLSTSTSTPTSEMPAPSSPLSIPPTPSVAFVEHQTQQQQQQQQQQEQQKQQPFLLQHRPLITTATQTALRRQDIPTMYHFEYDVSDKENKIASIDEPQAGASLSLTPCPICSRRFNTESLRKHIVICEKMAAKQRKPFDSSRQRREGTELAEFSTKGPPAKSPQEVDEKSTRSLNVDSKRKQAASTNSSGNNNGTAAPSLPQSPKAPNASNASAPKAERAPPKPRQGLAPASKQCPHCDRHFGIKAYDRHVEWCKEKSLQSAMKNSNSTKDKAKERLAARTKYRAPIKTKRSLNREKYAGLTADENEEDENPKAMSSSMVSNSSLIDSSYDPFLSAKRQLEDLCASGSPPDHDTLSPQHDTKNPSTPTTPSALIPIKMSTSLTLSASIPSNSSSPSTPKSLQNRKNPTTTTTATTATNATTTPTSNFRRTTSLRGPRRSPLLNARPFFAQKRPTIQRGLSDEGPISTNFLKSEEYDEIPVRSVCVNDYAITNSPRVVRRDTSLSNRKAGFKLNFSETDHHHQQQQPSNNSATLAQNSDERITANTCKDLSKTDSLAVFLKYERELEKLQFDGAQSRENDSKNMPELAITANESHLNEDSKPVRQVITKELKDKSNNLSKQNSAKSLSATATATAQSPSPSVPASVDDTKPIKKFSSCIEQNIIQNNAIIQAPKDERAIRRYSGNSSNSSHSDNVPIRQVRLEPLQHPITSTTAEQPSQLPLLSHHSSTSIVAKSNNVQREQNCPLNTKAQPMTTTTTTTTTTANGLTQSMPNDKENKALSSSSEFIDPMLINKCDNLPVKMADLKYADSDSSTEQQQQQRQQQQKQPNQVQRMDRATDPYERYVAPISQLSSFLPLMNKTNANTSSQTATHMRNAQTQSTPKHIKATVTPAALLPPTQYQTHPHAPHTPHSSHSHGTTSSDNACSISNGSSRNLLKRKMRLGRNQFLYDASPEALEIESSCSADDETNPRSSAEYDSNLNNKFEQFVNNRQTNQPFPYKAPSPSHMPNLPIFDDFDFEEFLSSFENDDDGEQFPLFKDCRDFLRNRPANKIASSITTSTCTSTPNRPNASNKPMLTSKIPIDPNTYQNQNFFQFPVLHNAAAQVNPTHILTPSSRRSSMKATQNRTEMRNDDFHSACSGDSMSLPGDGQANQNDFQHGRKSEDDFKKREIFISIETEQNDELDRASISPNSLRNMVGNSQAIVEVEVDANDNKFSKITDDDDNDNDKSNRDENGNNHQLPNVEMNNARNLIQKIGEENREICGGEFHDDNNDKSNNNVKVDGTGDSDELSSLEGYPFASNSSSRLSAGVASKISVDSAYGSLSRQRSTELMGKSAPRSSSRTRPATATTSNISQLQQQQQQQQQFLLQQQYQQQLMLQQQKHMKYAQAMLKNSRMRQLSGSSSSSSDNSFPPILVPNPISLQQQQQQQFLLQQQQQQQQMSQLYQQKPRNRNSPVAAATPMSRFCHECGSKFLVDNAKFCMDCGAKRLMI